MTEQRLPIVNGDDGTWGDILRQFLQKEHYDTGVDNAANGGHKTITIRPGTSTAGTAPLKFTSGTNLTTPEAGAMEFTTDTLYFTITTGPTRKRVALYDNGSPGATGDIFYRDSSGNFTRLAMGTTGQVLKAATSNPPSWGYTNSGFNTPAAITATTYTVTSSDTVVFANAASNSITITLPAASGLAGYRFYIKRIDNSANTVTVQRTSPDTIDGANSVTLDLQYASLCVVSNGTLWYIL